MREIKFAEEFANRHTKFWTDTHRMIGVFEVLAQLPLLEKLSMPSHSEPLDDAEGKSLAEEHDRIVTIMRGMTSLTDLTVGYRDRDLGPFRWIDHIDAFPAVRRLRTYLATNRTSGAEVDAFLSAVVRSARVEHLDLDDDCASLSRGHSGGRGCAGLILGRSRTALSVSTADEDLPYELGVLVGTFPQLQDFELFVGQCSPCETSREDIEAALGSLHRLSNLRRLALHIDADRLTDCVLEEWPTGLASLGVLTISDNLDEKPPRCTSSGLARLLRLPKLHTLKLTPLGSMKPSEALEVRFAVQQANDAGRHPPLELRVGEKTAWGGLTRLAE